MDSENSFWWQNRGETDFRLKTAVQRTRLSLKIVICDNEFLSQTSQDGGLLLNLHMERGSLNQTKGSKMEDIGIILKGK